MWSKSDKYSIFMLLWMISAGVASSKGFAIVFGLIGIGYGLLAIYNLLREHFK